MAKRGIKPSSRLTPGVPPLFSLTLYSPVPYSSSPSSPHSRPAAFSLYQSIFVFLTQDLVQLLTAIEVTVRFFNGGYLAVSEVVRCRRLVCPHNRLASRAIAVTVLHPDLDLGVHKGGDPVITLRRLSAIRSFSSVLALLRYMARTIVRRGDQPTVAADLDRDLPVDLYLPLDRDHPVDLDLPLDLAAVLDLDLGPVIGVGSTVPPRVATLIIGNQTRARQLADD